MFAAPAGNTNRDHGSAICGNDRVLAPVAAARPDVASMVSGRMPRPHTASDEPLRFELASTPAELTARSHNRNVV